MPGGTGGQPSCRPLASRHLPDQSASHTLVWSSWHTATDKARLKDETLDASHKVPSELEQDPGSAPPPSRHKFDRDFRAMDRGGRTITACYLDAYGEEAVPDADPYSAIALSELQWLIRSARLARGQIVVDLGCGRGGPGRVLARSTSVRLIGIDFSIVGVTSAATRAAGMVPRPAYIACDARAIPLADHSVDAVISIDVLQLIPERELVLREVARVLRPAGFIAFSSWELIAEDESVPPRLRRLPRDYTAVVAAAGLRVRDLQVPKGAREREAAFWANVTASADELRRELGEETAASVLGEASLANIFAVSTRRVLCVAQS